MVNNSNIEHLSPNQQKALTALKAGNEISISSFSINGLIDLLSLIIRDRHLSIYCDQQSFDLLNDYKERHSYNEHTDYASTYKRYTEAVTNLTTRYSNGYPISKNALHHQYNDLLSKYDYHPSTNDALDVELIQKHANFSADRSLIRNKITQYKSTWYRYINIDPFKDTYYREVDKGKVSKVLSDSLVKLNLLYATMLEELAAIVNIERDKVNAKRLQITKLLYNYHNTSNESTLKDLRVRLSFLLPDSPQNSYSDFTQLAQYIIDNWDSTREKYLSRYATRLNSRNHRSDRFVEAYQDFVVLLTNIKNANWIKIPTSANPLSYTSQITYIEEIIAQLQYCQSWESDEDPYIQWQTYYQNLKPNDRSFIDDLLKADNKNYSYHLDCLEIIQWKDTIIKKGIPTTDSSLALFDAFKEINECIDWTNIQLTTEQNVPHDYSITYNGTLFTLLLGKNTSGQKQIILDDKILDHIKPMRNLDYYTASMQADNLAKALNSVDIPYRVFQSKNLNIISALDEIDNKVMLEFLASYSLNELKDESTYALIKGSILDESKEKLLIIYEDILDVQSIHTYIWQRQVIQSMSMAGYQIVSITIEAILDNQTIQSSLNQHITSLVQNAVKL